LLGYTQSSWHNVSGSETQPASWSKSWDELTVCDEACVSERAAAMVLGYTQVSWDNESGEEQQPLTDFLSWAVLTDDEKAAGTLLGYTATNWDNLSGSEPQPAVVDKSWSELTSCADDPEEVPAVTAPPPACDSEHAGAVTLGYTKLSWDDESGQERKPLASFKSWSQLTANEKAGAALLGYTQSSWDNVSGSEMQPASWSKSWDELTVCDGVPVAVNTATTEILWVLGMSPAEQNQTVRAGDEVVFKWSGVHNVYMFQSKAAFDVCDFSEAVELASHLQTSYTYKATTEGTFFFACEISGHCEMGQKMSLAVTSGQAPMATNTITSNFATAANTMPATIQLEEVGTTTTPARTPNVTTVATIISTSIQPMDHATTTVSKITTSAHPNVTDSTLSAVTSSLRIGAGGRHAISNAEAQRQALHTREYGLVVDSDQASSLLGHVAATIMVCWFIFSQ